MSHHKAKCPECNEIANLSDNGAITCKNCGYYDIVCPLCEDHIGVCKIEGTNNKYICEYCEEVITIKN